MEEKTLSEKHLVEEKPKRDWLKIIVFSLVGAFLLFGAFYAGYWYGVQQSKPEAPKPAIPTPTQALIPTPTSTLDPTVDWKTFTIKTMGLEFKIPSELSKMGNLEENILSGEKGNLLCVTFSKKNSFLIQSVFAAVGFCDVNTFALGTTSVDFEAGRMAGFSDLQGFEVIQGKYYAKLLGKKFEIPKELINEVTNPNGIKILKIIGRNSTTGEWQGPIAGTPGDGWIGALVNIDNNPKYLGITVQMKLENNLTQKLFDQILSSFKFLD